MVKIALTSILIVMLLAGSIGRPAGMQSVQHRAVVTCTLEPNAPPPCAGSSCGGG